MMTRLKALALFAMAAWPGYSSAEAGWPAYGGDQGGLRYSEAAEITPANVNNLVRAWEFKTGDLAARPRKVMRRAKMQVTPVLAEGSLYMCTSFNAIIALDPGTGTEKWRFDPKIETEGVFPANRYNCRGVAVWRDPLAASDATCALRVFTGTMDSRVIAVDGRTGRPCTDFGSNGSVEVKKSLPDLWPGEFNITSAPAVAGDVLVVGSAIGDNQRVKAQAGTVHAFDARTGALRWTFDPVPRDPANPLTAQWGEGWRDVGHANVWAPMSVDEPRGLIFMPTSSASPDFFGGLRPGDNRHANSVVALEAATGTLKWAYQIVHHDVWDYDTPAQPTLATLNLDGGPRDVVIQGTKQGFIFVLNRDTGVPVFPVEERPVPQGGAAGEVLSPTQPFPTHVPALVPQHLKPDDAFGLTPWDRDGCRKAIAAARSEGLYTPPSERGTVLFPFTGGGINWGGVSFDPHRQILYANTSRAAHLVTLFKAEDFDALDKKYPSKEVSPQKGAPFGMIREALLGPALVPLPCNPPPWGTIAAVDLKGGKILWEKTLGTIEEYTGGLLALPWGTPNLGGPVATKGGVIFIGAAMDNYLRAFDAKSGAELWQGRLPAIGAATPMTYVWEERQYVVIAAGGYPDAGIEAPGDSLVAFRLPRAGEAGPSLWSRTIDRPGGRGWAALVLGIIVLIGLVWAIRLTWRWARG